MVEPLMLFLVSALDRQPVHCAGLVRRGRVVLLAGPPGVGKSTLAYTGLVRGWGVMAEDIVWVQRQPQFRIWGYTSVIKLPPDAFRHIPRRGRRGLDPSPVRGGDESKALVEVPVGARPFPPVAHEGIIVLLQRGPAAGLKRVDRATLVHELSASLQPGFDRFPGAVPALVDGMGRAGGWRLVMGSDPSAALVLVETLIDAAMGATSPA